MRQQVIQLKLDSVNNHNYASKPRGNIIIGSSADISNTSIEYATGVGFGDLSGTGSAMVI